MSGADDGITPAVEAVRRRATIGAQARRPSARAGALTAHTLAGAGLLIALLIAGLPAVPGVAPGLDLQYHPGPVAVFVALVCLYVVAYRIEFDATGGSMVPTQPVLVAMVVLGPLQLVPLGVLVGVLAGSVGSDHAEGGRYGWSVRAIPAWHSFGPVAVLLTAGVAHPSSADWLLLVVALACQFLLDALTAVIRLRSIGVDPKVLIEPLTWTFRVDSLMAVIGAGLVFSARDIPSAVVVLLVATPVALVAVLSRDRDHHVRAAESLGAAYEHVSQEATTDALTGVGNRRRWDDGIARARERHEEDPSVVVTVVIADLDGLKLANDRFGHETGDALIARFAQVLSDVAPSGAIVARLGGDEFGVLVIGGHREPGQDGASEGGVALLETIRAEVQACPLVQGARLSASLGCASCPPDDGVDDVVRNADQAAARDKQERSAGRT